MRCDATRRDATRCDVTQLQSQFKQLPSSPRKIFPGLQRNSNPSPLRLATVLYHLSYEDRTWRAGQYFELIKPRKEWNTELKLCELRKYKWDNDVTIFISFVFLQFIISILNLPHPTEKIFHILHPAIEILSSNFVFIIQHPISLPNRIESRLLIDHLHIINKLPLQ